MQRIIARSHGSKAQQPQRLLTILGLVDSFSHGRPMCWIGVLVEG
jgi:hypothetical protein